MNTIANVCKLLWQLDSLLSIQVTDVDAVICNQVQITSHCGVLFSYFSRLGEKRNLADFLGRKSVFCNSKCASNIRLVLMGE